MKINPFEIAKMAKKALANKDIYKAKAEELKANPPVGSHGKAQATFDGKTNRIAKIEYEGLDPQALEEIRQAVNQVFDMADKIWEE